MLVSLKNINEFVSLNELTPEEVANKLTFAGIEVEEISNVAQGTNLVIGKILECEKHPDSDHLHVLKVDLGSTYGVEQIVCGAPNARVGLKVIVARPGSVLPGGEIKKGIIRGIESNGMCCSLSELGVDSKYLTDYQLSGIEELCEDAPIGEENVLGYLGLDDVVLNLKVLANRPDLLSLHNVAREIAALFERKVEIPVPPVKEDFLTKLNIKSNTSKCMQFASKEIRNIVTKPSPKWLSSYLMAMGIRSINNIVDIGNYVMLMTGQPLHMYDADKLEKAELIVKDDYCGDFIALDKKTYKVIPGDIVITCNDKPMCLGGVMGSLECAVDENTKNIYIESASFDGASIRHTSTRLGLSSESSSRFVKGTCHFNSEYVLNYAAELVTSLCEAKECSNIVCFQEEEKELQISTTLAKINGRLGTNFSIEQIKNVLNRLYFKVVSDENDNIVVSVPKFRLDVSCDADLSEEIIRVLGFENVKSVLPCLDTKVGLLNERQQRLKNIRNFLLDKGLDECLTYSLISKKEENCYNLLHSEEKYSIINPLTDEHEVFRTHILHSLLKVATYNVARQNRNLLLFETANLISKNSRSDHLAVVLLGNNLSQDYLKTEPFDFYYMKGLVESIFEILGIEQSRYKFEKINTHLDELHPGKSANIVFQNNVIGILGEMHPNKVKDYDLGKNPAIVLELNLDQILDAKVSSIKMQQISKFPSIQRDLAFVVSKNVMAKDIIKTIKVTGKGIVNDAFVFDVYEGENIAENKKSMAFSIIYSNPNATLTDKEVNDVESKIKLELIKSYCAEFRM